MGYLKLWARHLDQTINKKSFWWPPTPPNPSLPLWMNPITPLDPGPTVSAWQLGACAASLLSIVSNASEQPAAQSWTRTENNVVSRGSERSCHRNRASELDSELVNVFDLGPSNSSDFPALSSSLPAMASSGWGAVIQWQPADSRESCTAATAFDYERFRAVRGIWKIIYCNRNFNAGRLSCVFIITIIIIIVI